MPVTTRYMARHARDTSSRESLVDLPDTSSFAESDHELQFVPELVDQCSSSSSSSADSTTSLSSEDDFEISNFQNFECTPRFPINSTLHNF